MYFHTDEPRTVAWLAAILRTAEENGDRIRIDVDGKGELRIKRAGGVWSPPIASTLDPWRDNR